MEDRLDLASTPATALLAPDALLDALAARRRGGRSRGTRRMEALCRALGSPHRAMPAVHIVGTDGKTSVARMVTALLEAAGVRTGETTSPHLHRPRERVRLGGRPIGDDALLAAATALNRMLPEVDRQVGEPATFFEAVTALALRAFADASVDVAVVEAGIGGVGDATNIVSSDVTVVTPVALDHAELGSSISEVAREKAGVVTSGGVVVTASQQPDAAAAIADVAARRGARLLRVGIDAGVRRRRPAHGGHRQQVSLFGIGGTEVEVELPLLGAHQAANAALALAAAQALVGPDLVGPDVVRAGLAAVEVPGRLELLCRPGLAEVLLDGAHDRLAVRALATSLQELPTVDRCVVVLGVGKGHDPRPLVDGLAPLASGFVATRAGSPFALPADVVVDAVAAVDAPVVATPGIADALTVADELVVAGDRLVVTGSLHLVGEARRVLTAATAVRV